MTASESEVRAAGVAPAQLSRSRLRDMYWTFGQMAAHHASNGCNLRPGDLLVTFVWLCGKIFYTLAPMPVLFLWANLKGRFMSRAEPSICPSAAPPRCRPTR